MLDQLQPLLVLLTEEPKQFGETTNIRLSSRLTCLTGYGKNPPMLSKKLRNPLPAQTRRLPQITFIVLFVGGKQFLLPLLFPVYSACAVYLLFAGTDEQLFTRKTLTW